jgi:hypothetical protein
MRVPRSMLMEDANYSNFSLFRNETDGEIKIQETFDKLFDFAHPLQIGFVSGVHSIIFINLFEYKIRR